MKASAADAAQQGPALRRKSISMRNASLSGTGNGQGKAVLYI
ncbi:MAG: hypothetical protein VW599_05745 [Pseudomonadales bacterium]